MIAPSRASFAHSWAKTRWTSAAGRTFAWLLAVLLGSVGVVRESRAQEPGAKPSPEDVAFFEKEVQPLLKQHCQKCHSGKAPKGNLQLTSRAGLLKGGDAGPAISLTKPAESVLVSAINYRDFEMPPSGKLPANQIAVLTEWVRRGAPFAPGAEEPLALIEKPITIDPARHAASYYAYKPLARPAPPAVKNAAWVQSPIDAFILAKLEANGLTPAPPADKVALVRRVYFDLTGLPPTPAQVDAFLADNSPKPYEKLLDELLNSPQYGEKWGRYWLDLVRYAESHGYERDSAKPFAWRYRDYVIEAFNSDKPYDQFLREQLAGDELDEVTPETMTATGFYRLGIWDDEPADRELAVYDVLDGVVSTTGGVMLGMSLGCARCHDHKKDPLPQRDYYRMLAFFRDITPMNRTNTRLIETAAERQRIARLTTEKLAREAELTRALYRLEQQFQVAWAKAHPTEPLSAAAADIAELKYRFYRSTWESLPDFEQLKPEETGDVAEGLVSLAPASRSEAIGLVFEGRLRVPQDGEYSLEVEASEGVRVTLGGKTVIDAPAKGVHRKSGQVQLAAGLVPLRVDYFNSVARPRLKLAWSGPGFSKRSLSEAGDQQNRVLLADSRMVPQDWKHQFGKAPPNWFKPSFPAANWKSGPGGFGAKGTPGSQVRTEWTDSDIYLRQTFTVQGKLPTALTLVLHHDEDCEVYLNGELVYQATGYLRDYEQVNLPATALKHLKLGENLLAVHCKQTGGGQYIDCGLVEPSGRVMLAELIRREGAKLLGPEAAADYAAKSKALDESRLAAIPPVGVEIMCVDERGAAPTHVLGRGNPGLVGERVSAGVPALLGGADLPPVPVKNGSGKRRALAEWITSDKNPIAARVLANRLWQQHFGRGLTPSSNDFGLLGEQPSHPELLDWLAVEVKAGGWKLKRMHKLIMLSAAYQMSTAANPAALAQDGNNFLLWRFNMRRLTAEEVRDSILAASGQLNLKAGGPSIYPVIPAEVLAGQSRPGDGWGRSPPEEAARRSIYVHVKRSLQLPILATHDQADTDNSCPVRYTTTVPTQALGMLNGQFTNEQAVALARRLEREATELPAQIERAIRLTAGRKPAAEEVQKDLAFVRHLIDQQQVARERALELYCLLILNTNEFLYLN